MKTSAFLIALIALCVAFAFPRAEQDTSVYEIRNYNIHPEQIANYKTWIDTHGLPHIRQHMDVVGFWVKGDIDAEVNGEPLDELGSPNVTWIIRWDTKEQRDEVMQKVFGSPEWQEIFAKFPGGGEAYLRVEAKFFDAL